MTCVLRSDNERRAFRFSKCFRPASVIFASEILSDVIVGNVPMIAKYVAVVTVAMIATSRNLPEVP